eukprot:COSAG03_NODE_10424_length_652_cov_0.450271_2_plen_97_part_00
MMLSSERADCWVDTLLGNGSSANVYKGTFRFKGTQKVTAVAFKVFRDSKLPAVAEQIRSEAQAHIKLKHPHLIEMFGVCDLPDFFQAEDGIRDGIS